MKKLGKLMLIGFIAMVGFTACNGGDDPVTPPIVDDRDQFVGAYSIDVVGSATFVVEGQTMTYPMDESGDLVIKFSPSSSNMVVVSGFYEGMAEVSGNSILIDPETQTESEDGMTMTMTITHSRGLLSGNTLTFKSTISGTIYYEGASYPITGSISNVATKL